jgi:subtilisin family serine protease
MPVAIIDTGIDLSHPDLVDKIWANPGENPDNSADDDGNGYVDDVHGYDFVNEDGDPGDDHGHGTHVAGIVAAATDNGLGVAGMAPANPLMALKVLSSSGEGSYFDVARAIDYAREQGARVMNLSLAGLDDSSVLHEAVQAATAAGAVVVAAAGNCGSGCSIEGQYYVNPILYPAAYDEVLAVGATGGNDEIASLSEHHPYVDVAAPGIGVYSTTRGGGYGYKSGTSMATPHAAGLVALLWAAAPALTQAEVVEQIAQGAEDLGAPGKDDYYGWGRINARSSLCALIPPLLASPPTLSFMADGYSLSVPASESVEVASGCMPITWTATISPSASWMHLTPVSGTLGQMDSHLLRVDVDPAELGEDYGEYTSQVELATTWGTGEDVVDIHLHYVPRIHQLILLFIDKS